MNKFLKKTFLIGISILIAFIIAVIIATRYYRSQDYYPFSTMNDIIEGRLNSDLWFLGSSRTLVQYNPGIFDSILDVSSYTMGCDGLHIAFQIQCYQIAREFNDKPKYIILDLLWQSLDMEMAQLSRYAYMPYINIQKVRQIVKNNYNLSFAYLYFPYYRFHLERKSGQCYKNIKIYKGYQARDIPWSPVDLDGLDTIHYHQEKQAIELLDSFLHNCCKDSISVILIHSPFQREGFEKIQNHDEMLDLFRSIAKRHNIPFLDYTEDPICYDTLYFYNAMHLNAHGADIFSTKLAHDLDSLGLIPARK
jgi:hypothetical protein